MLFHPWRNEKDLISSFKTYQEHCNLLQVSFKDKEAEYNHNTEAVDQAIESLDTESNDFTHDVIAPNTEHVEQWTGQQEKWLIRERPMDLMNGMT